MLDNQTMTLLANAKAYLAPKPGPKTIEQVKAAEAYQREGKHALALLHLNAAAVFAAAEMPQHIPAIRETAEHYRAELVARRHQESGI